MASSSTSPKASDIGQILRQKRKHRPQRACHPCRLRKVKCSYSLPCETCVERNHPELCSYEETAKRSNTDTFLVQGRLNRANSPSNRESWAPSDSEWQDMRQKLDMVSESVRAIQDQLQHLIGFNSRSNSANDSLAQGSHHNSHELQDNVDYDVHGVPASNILTGEEVYLGSKSVPAMVMALSRENGNDAAVQELLSKSVLPIFALDNESATYPFVDLWGVPHGSTRRLDLLCSVLPSDADCNQIFRQYRDTAYVVYPAIADIVRFEGGLIEFLTQRRNGHDLKFDDGLTQQLVFGKSVHWLGLFFAVLASGMQCSDLPRKEILAKSQVYVCCAYECLRIVNYMSHATLLDVQNLLVIGNVLSNNMNAGVAWTLLGITTRIAQNLGLHYDIPSDSTPAQTTKVSIWCQIMWQDSLLSITFDRFSSLLSASNTKDVPDLDASSYVYAMRRVCRIGLNVVQERATARTYHQHLLHVSGFRDGMDNIMASLEGHLTGITQCKSMKDQLEYWNFHLHRSYIMSELCRATIGRRRDSGRLQEKQKILEDSLRSTCITNLANTVEAFLGLHNVTRFAVQSWAAIHRSLSSALLLGILGEPGRDQRTKGLIWTLHSVLCSVQSEVDSMEKAAPITRSLEALASLMPWGASTESDADRSFQLSVELDNLEPQIPKTAPGSAGTAAVPTNTSPMQTSESDANSPMSILNSIMWGKGSNSSSAWSGDASSWTWLDPNE